MSNFSHRESIFSRARQSFRRSSGARGANVETLQGLTGADFEGYCRVTRGNRSARCFASIDSEPNKKRYVLIKGPNLFVFAKATSPAPKYAIELAHKKATLHPVVGMHKQIVTIESGLGDVDYKFLFYLQENNADIAKDFVKVLREQIASGETNEMKEKLGHRCMQHSKSIKFATAIAVKKKKDQPDVPISATEIMANDPSCMAY